jgi:nucleoside-diphosphate-sugar epimerase
LCRLFYREHGMGCVVLRTSRFFPEEDDDRARRSRFKDANLKTNEYLYRRVELADVVSAHLCAAQRTGTLGFGRYLISATTPFLPEDTADLGGGVPAVVSRRVPGYEAVYRDLGWRMFDALDRVYVNEKARRDLGWRPKYDFGYLIGELRDGGDITSALARTIGAKGYNAERFEEGPYPV